MAHENDFPLWRPGRGGHTEEFYRKALAKAAKKEQEPKAPSKPIDKDFLHAALSSACMEMSIPVHLVLSPRGSNGKYLAGQRHAREAVRRRLAGRGIPENEIALALKDRRVHHALLSGEGSDL